MEASTSAWLWDPQHSLYYNPETRIWAAPQANGEWKYSDTTGTANDETPPTPPHMEEGEVITTAGQGKWKHNEPELEGGEEDRYAKAPILRLVVLSSQFLPSTQCLALVDPAEALSIGRDRCHTPRIRLKEIEVSKAHAVVFWLSEGLEEYGGEGNGTGWAIADSGSTHGTFVKRKGNSLEKRLSGAKMASSPYALKHSDVIRVGTSTFTIHIHASFPCSTCTLSPDSSNLIPLITLPDSSTTPVNQSTQGYTTKTKAEKEVTRREKMKGLKDQFLKPKIPSSSSSSTPTSISSSSHPTLPNTPTVAPQSSLTKPAPPIFYDRAAARRHRGGAPPQTTPLASLNPLQTLTPTTMITNPFDPTTRGAQLLTKLSSSSSHSQAGLGTLILAKSFGPTVGREEKPGLGSRKLVVVGESESGSGGAEGKGPTKRGWREEVKEASRKRFQEMQ